MKNLRNRRTVELAASEEKLKKFAAQPFFKQFKIFHENLAAVKQAKVHLTLNRQIYVGFAILNLSNSLMYISITIRSSESIQTRRCCLLIQIPSRIKFKWITCMKTSTPVSSCSIFLGTDKKVHSTMMKIKK